MIPFYTYVTIVAVLMMTGCGSSQTETTTSLLDSEQVDAVQVTQETSVASIHQPVENATPTPSVHYVGNPDTFDARNIGDMILKGTLQPGDNVYTYRMMDSLQSGNKQNQLFYFRVFNKIIDHAEGALGEAIGNYALSYIEQYPAEFIANINQLPTDRFETWASHIGIELFLSSNEVNQSFRKFSQTTKENCRGCNKATINRLQQFNTLVWQTMEVNIKGEREQKINDTLQ